MGGTGRLREFSIGYEQLPSQREFHRSKARFKGFSGPIGSGKSHALCWEAIRMSYINPGRLGLLGAPTYPMLRDATQATLLDILDRTLTPMGGRLLKRWMLLPLKDITAIEERLDAVSYFLKEEKTADTLEIFCG